MNLAIVFHETDQLRFMYRGWLGFRVPQPIRLCRFLASKEGLDHGVWRRDLFLVLNIVYLKCCSFGLICKGCTRLQTWFVNWLLEPCCLELMLLCCKLYPFLVWMVYIYGVSS